MEWIIYCNSMLCFYFGSLSLHGSTISECMYIAYISEGDFYFEVLGSDISISVCQRTETCSPFHDNVFTHKKQEYNNGSANTSLFTAGFLCRMYLENTPMYCNIIIHFAPTFKMKFPSYWTTNFSCLKVITRIFCH